MKLSFQWVEKAGMLTRMWKFFVGVSVFLVAIDFVIPHEHTYLIFETIPGFSAVYGFVACTALVVFAKVLRKICKRDMKYYD
tara:strand:- start:1546 stop:1791 length:246 start_codon:yes stop_codon:yes gene_type:complete